MADDPLRLRILKNLTASLEQISIADGYKHDMDGSVFRGRVIFGEGDPLPMLSILEVPIPLDQTPSPSGSTDSKGLWELLIQGFVLDDPENPTDPAHVLMADVKKRLAVERRRYHDYQILDLGEHVTNIFIGAGTVRPPDEISSEAYFWLNISLEVVENHFDPYED